MRLFVDTNLPKLRLTMVKCVGEIDLPERVNITVTESAILRSVAPRTAYLNALPRLDAVGWTLPCLGAESLICAFRPIIAM